MREFLARFFRWNNSWLITTDNVIVEKARKLVMALSLIAHRNARSQDTLRPVVIRNFDLDLSLQIDRGRAMGRALYWTGFHEFREFQFLHRYLKPDMVFVDVGANLGEYTLFAAKRVSAGKVLAFEPLPSIRATLEQNVRMNGFRNIEIFPVGLSSREELLAIHEIEDVHEGLATFFPGSRQSKSSTHVALKRLDDVISSLNLNRVDFVKIDIEGGELKALEGSREVINRYRPTFMVEINEETYGIAGYAPADVMKFFLDAGYAAYEIQKRGAVVKCHSLPRFGNILFFPQ